MWVCDHMLYVGQFSYLKVCFHVLITFTGYISGDFANAVPSWNKGSFDGFRIKSRYTTSNVLITILWLIFYIFVIFCHTSLVCLQNFTILWLIFLGCKIMPLLHFAGEMLFYNIAYEIFAWCTSIIAQTPNGLCLIFNYEDYADFPLT